jgi:hypothetical protein
MSQLLSDISVNTADKEEKNWLQYLEVFWREA